MKLYRATYSLLELDGHVKVDEQWSFLRRKIVLTLWKKSQSC